MRPMTMVSDTPMAKRDRLVLHRLLTRVGLPADSITITHVVPDANYTPFRAARNRAAFLASLSSPVVIVPMGTDALYNLMGLRPSTLYRGLIPPSWAQPIELGPETLSPTLPASTEWVIPTISPSGAWGAGGAFLLEADLDRARRALTGQLHIVGSAT